LLLLQLLLMESSHLLNGDCGCTRNVTTLTTMVRCCSHRTSTCIVVVVAVVDDDHKRRLSLLDETVAHRHTII
jgi:hypothetical protein